MGNRKLLPYILISIFLHATLLYIGIEKSETKATEKKKEVVQVSFIHLQPSVKPKLKPEKQIVALPDHNNQEPTEPAHLSEENNSVVEETIAKKSGPRAGSSPKTEPSGDGINLFPPNAISGVAGDTSGDNGSSSNSNDENIEGVREGDTTALNAVEFKFASFFNRIKKDISGYWRPLPLLYRFDPTGRLLDQERKTLLYIVLDDKGNILKITLYKSSGVDFLDDEAVRAVLACDQFPNPPKGLIKDGRVEFLFGFQVYRGGGFLLW